jgi:hypothetical protein
VNLPAFLVTATILVEADDEVRASRKALAKILMEPSIALDVQSDSEHHSRVIIPGVERQELIREAGLICQANEDRPS